MPLNRNWSQPAGLRVDITDDMRAEAQRQADDLGVIRNSIRSGEGSVYGFLGELIFVAVKGGQQVNTYDYDIEINGYTVDVKTKCCTSQPRTDYDCSVAAFNTSQACDYYAFVRVLDDLSVGWYLGAIARDDFYQQARFWKKGEVDPRNDWTVTADCYSVPVSALF